MDASGECGHLWGVPDRKDNDLVRYAGALLKSSGQPVERSFPLSTRTFVSQTALPSVSAGRPRHQACVGSHAWACGA